MTFSRITNPDQTPPLPQAIPLGIQHVLAMFASNVTPSIIIAGAAGLAGGDKVYLIQMAILFSGIATLMQTIGFSKVGARLPVMQGTSFAFIPIMIPIAKSAGVAAVLGGAIIGGIFHFFLGSVIGKARKLMPPLVTGTVILAIGLALIPVGIKYAAGGVWLMNNKPELFGQFNHWGLALVVIITTFGVKFFMKGFVTSAATLIGLIAGYVVAIIFGQVNFDGIGKAAWFAIPQPFKFGFDVNVAAVVGMCLMAVVSAIETVGDISGITRAGANREATDKEIAGGTMADGLGTALAGVFGGLPNTSFSQNVGLIGITGVMSRHVVTIGAGFLIIAGLMPKIGAVISAMPQAVLGGGVLIMFGMVASAGLNMIKAVAMTRRNMIIIALALSFGLGLQAVPLALQHLPSTLKLLLASGLLPVAVIAVALNILLPQEPEEDAVVVAAEDNQ